MTRTLDVDFCVIGAGSGGLSAAAGAVQLGKSVVLCEKGEMGGDCLNTGCVPSKALIAAASAAHIGGRRDLGINARPEADYAAVMGHVKSVIAAIAPHDSEERFTELGCIVLRGAATFEGPRRLRCGETLVNAKHFVIATGSSPAIPSIPGLEDVPVLTNETIWDNRTLPRHLIVIGGGAVGLELGQAHRRLGAEVTIVEAARLLGAEDEEAVAVLRAALLAEGVNLREGAAPKSARQDGADIVIDLGTEKLRGSHLLIAAGRKPNVEGLALETAGVEIGKRGILVDDRLRTANKRIFAIGDVVGGAFTHVAGDQASTVIRNACFKLPAKRRDALAPRAVFTDPEIAAIGLGEKGARETFGDAIRIARWPFEDNDRAQAEKETEGFAKIIAHRNGRLLGAVIVGKAAGDTISLFSLALSNGLKISAFTKMIPPYPTRGEIFKRAAGAFYTPALFSGRTRRILRLLSAFD
jgi:pyruvate/2-oxoglutarate dehydrogenase complex dihydrolipoamide dehydrogenase (E3) component